MSSAEAVSPRRRWKKRGQLCSERLASGREPPPPRAMSEAVAGSSQGSASVATSDAGSMRFKRSVALALPSTRSSTTAAEQSASSQPSSTLPAPTASRSCVSNVHCSVRSESCSRARFPLSASSSSVRSSELARRASPCPPRCPILASAPDTSPSATSSCVLVQPSPTSPPSPEQSSTSSTSSTPRAASCPPPAPQHVPPSKLPCIQSATANPPSPRSLVSGKLVRPGSPHSPSRCAAAAAFGEAKHADDA